MKKLLILLLFSFPLVAEEKIILLCEGTMFTEFTNTKEKSSYKESIVLKIDDKGINVDSARYERTLIQKDSKFETYTDYRKNDVKIYYYHDAKYLSDGKLYIIYEGHINRITSEFTQRVYNLDTKFLRNFNGKCRKAERAF